ncbi:hypothetical protein R69746_04615 [Paraburkholderia aspalathi]|nr:hypothetical protein R69746_04615 [Paraburkholderia aspalathi]
MRVLDRILMTPGRDNPGDVRHIHHQLRAHAIGDCAQPCEVQCARISGEAGDQQRRFVLLCEFLDLLVIDQHRVAIHAVLDRIEPLARHRRLGAVGQVATRVERHAEHRVARLHQREHHRAVGLRAGMRLHVGKLRVEELLDAIERQRFDHVGVFTPAVIALARIPFRVLVGQHRALRFEHRARHDVFRRDQFDLRLLALQLFQNGAAHRRVTRGQRFFEERIRVRHGRSVGWLAKDRKRAADRAVKPCCHRSALRLFLTLAPRANLRIQTRSLPFPP